MNPTENVHKLLAYHFVKIRNICGDLENELMVTKRERWRGDKLGVWTDIHTLPYTK